MTLNWRELVFYDENSPTKLRWLVERRCGNRYNRVLCRPGDVAGYNPEAGGYGLIRYGNASYAIHTVVWELHNKPVPEGLTIDHKDGNTVNNSISNLRLATSRVNSRNMKMFTTNTSGVTGVSFRQSSNSWQAHIFDETGKKTAKCFAVRKYGSEAFSLAVAWREKMLAQVNNRGGGYSSRHGQRGS